MKIEKEYNVQGLADKVKGCIKTVCETKQMLGDLATCFGKSYGRRYTAVCKTCKYKEQCKELTKHAEA